MKLFLGVVFALLKSAAVAATMAVIVFGALLGLTYLSGSGPHSGLARVPAWVAFGVILLIELFRSVMASLSDSCEAPTRNGLLLRVGSIGVALTIAGVFLPKVVFYLGVLMLVWGYDLYRRLRQGTPSE